MNPMRDRFEKVMQLCGVPLVCAAILAAGCASTGTGVGGNGNPGAPTGDTASGSDAASGTDASSGGDAGGGGTETAGGKDAATSGTEKTIASIQNDPTFVTCDPSSTFVDGVKGVTIHHAVVASPLVLSTTSSGKKMEGLFVQDKGGGKWSGLFLSEDAPGPLADLKPGDAVTITGDAKEFYCYTELQPIAVTKEMTTDLPVAVTVDVDTIGEKAAAADNEAYEGVFIALEGVVISDPALADSADKNGYLHTMAVGKDANDVALRVGAGFGKIYPVAKNSKTPNYKKGDKVNLQGFLEYSFSKWVLTPSSLTVL